MRLCVYVQKRGLLGSFTVICCKQLKAHIYKYMFVCVYVCKHIEIQSVCTCLHASLCSICVRVCVCVSSIHC